MPAVADATATDADVAAAAAAAADVTLLLLVLPLPPLVFSIFTMALGCSCCCGELSSCWMAISSPPAADAAAAAIVAAVVAVVVAPPIPLLLSSRMEAVLKKRGTGCGCGFCVRHGWELSFRRHIYTFTHTHTQGDVALRVRGNGLREGREKEKYEK